MEQTIFQKVLVFLNYKQSRGSGIILSARRTCRQLPESRGQFAPELPDDLRH